MCFRCSARLQGASLDAATSPLVCTSPFYAALTERWPGPVVYYQTDLVAAYDGVNGDKVRALDRRLCRTATAVCTNSRRIAEYMVVEAECLSRKVSIVPTATRAANVPPQVIDRSGKLPPDLADLHLPGNEH